MIQGDLQTFPLPDLIQWLALARQTGNLTITRGDQRLEFLFDAGEIAAASSSYLIGPDSPEKVRAVLASALALRLGNFIFEQCQLPEEVAAANLHLPAEAFLLDIARQFDEEQETITRSDSAVLPSPNSTVAAPSTICSSFTAVS